MNYYAFAMPVKGGLIDGTLPIKDFTRMIEERREKFSWEETLRVQNLFDSHDTDRMPSMIVNRDRPYYGKADAFAYDVDIWPGSHDKPYFIRKPDETERKLQRMIVLFQMTYPGAPYIYYGTEAGMWGADDPDDRMPMVWADLKFDLQTLSPGGQPTRQDDINFDSTLHDYYRDAIALRKKVSRSRAWKDADDWSRESESDVCVCSWRREHPVCRIQSSLRSSNLHLPVRQHGWHGTRTPCTDFCVFGQSIRCPGSAERRKSQYHLAWFYRRTFKAEIGPRQNPFLSHFTTNKLPLFRSKKCG